MHEALAEITKTAVFVIDAMALLTIVAGTVEAFVSGLIVLLSSRSGHEQRDVWLRYARWLVAGLTFQLAADIIETSITTDWESVARLGLVAVIRTLLNYFLERDMEEVRARDRGGQPEAPAAARVLALFVAATFATSIVVGGPAAYAASDPLPSWNDGATKQAIVEFVGRVTKEGGPEFVPPAERIAVFDNDGTLWSEQPMYFQLAFAIDRIAAMAPEHPDWETTPPFSDILKGDMKAVAASGEHGLLEIVAATHSGITTEKFGDIVDGWIATAQHPKFRRPYTSLVFQPMLELLSYLRANDFKTFIVSGGGVEFMRRFAERVYGIPPEQVVGSSGVVKFGMGPDGKPELTKEPKIEFVDDGPGKPVGINRFIGRRPIFAFGNSDGDLQMLQYTAAGPGARFMGIVHHTDADREWAYDRASHVGKLDKALDEAKAKGWAVVDMKTDWNAVFPPEQ